MLKRLIPVCSLMAVVILLSLLNFTTPTEAGPLGVLIFFIAIYALMYGIAYLVVRVFAVIGRHKMGSKQYLYAAVMAFGPIMLLLMQSLKTINGVTVGLAVTFVLLGCFLISKK